MTAFLSFIAKPGYEDQINAEYSKLVGDPEAYLVYSAQVIEREIAFIQSPDSANSYSHVRQSLHTVADWNTIYPDYRLGSGFIRVNPRGTDNSAEINRIANFLITHREWFSKVEGLDAICSKAIENVGIRSRRPQAA